MLRFKDDRVQKEWYELPAHNARLRGIVGLASDFSSLEFGKDMVITCIYRTPAENTALYADTIRAGGKEPDWRPHTQWMGIDLRSSVYTDAEIQRLLAFFNQFTVFTGQRKCASYHQIAGNVMHFHVQADRGNQHG